MSVVLALFSVAFLSLLYWLIVKKGRIYYYLKNVPGPKPVLFFGNTLDFMARNKQLDTMIRYHNDHGDTILLQGGPLERVLMTIDYDLIELILSSSIYIDKSEQYDMFRDWLGQGLLTSTGTKWRKHRKMITPSFHFSVLQKYIEIFHNVGNLLVDNLEREVGNPSLEISKIISLYALDVICEAAMGVKINALSDRDSEYVKAIKVTCQSFVDKGNLPLSPLFYPLLPIHWREQRALKVIHGFVEDVIEKRSEEIKNECNSTDQNKDNEGRKNKLAFLDLLLRSNIDGRPLTKEELRDEVNTFMFEGHDTTSTVMSFCLYMLSLHPEIQKKVYEEQQHLFGEDLLTVRPTYAQLNEMKYLDLVIKETLRLFPPVPILGRTLSQDLQYKGRTYPKGLSVAIFPFGYHRSSKYFSDPAKFIPERFESQNDRPPFSYIPFSAGPRNCIGQKFASLEMLCTISHVIRYFELVQSVPVHSLILAPEVILISKNGIKLGLKRRK